MTKSYKSYWRQRAEQVITDALADAAADGLDRAATIRRVDSRYPFGPRAHWPYKVWLHVRQALVFGNVRPMDRRAERPSTAAAASGPLPGQADFFDLCDDG